MCLSFSLSQCYSNVGINACFHSLRKGTDTCNTELPFILSILFPRENKSAASGNSTRFFFGNSRKKMNILHEFEIKNVSLSVSPPSFLNPLLFEKNAPKSNPFLERFYHRISDYFLNFLSINFALLKHRFKIARKPEK